MNQNLRRVLPFGVNNKYNCGCQKGGALGPVLQALFPTIEVSSLVTAAGLTVASAVATKKKSKKSAKKSTKKSTKKSAKKSS